MEVEDLTVDIPSRRLIDGLNLRVHQGECVALMGPSGSSKTTLLHCIAGIRLPTGGTVMVAGRRITDMSEPKRAAHRLHQMGIVVQSAELLPELSVGKNVELPLRLMGVRASKRAASSKAILAQLGVEALAGASPETVSAGEAQRVAIARAVVHEPALVLADEPTGALDEANAAVVAGLLSRCARSLGMGILIATHDPLVARTADRIVHLRSGRLVDASGSTARDRVSSRMPGRDDGETQVGTCSSSPSD